jgi:hypothetical protein
MMVERPPGLLTVPNQSSIVPLIAPLSNFSSILPRTSLINDI